MATKPTLPRTLCRVPLARAVALFFLLFTAADILWPQYFCAAEGQTWPVVAQAAQTDVPSHPPTPPQDSRPHEEDCFCCCAHLVLPAVWSVFRLTTNITPPPRSLWPETLLPHAPPQTIYRPPRLA